MTVVTTITLVILAVAAGLVLIATVRSRALADRAVAVDALVAIILNGLAVGAVRTGELTMIILALVLSLFGFVGTTVIARYIERRGEERS